MPSTAGARRSFRRALPLLSVLFLCAPAAPLRAQGTLIIRKLDFQGNRAYDDVTIAAAIQTTSSSWFATSAVIRWVGLGEKRRLSEKDFERDVERIRLLYRIGGYLEVRVDTLVRRTAADAYITFKITEGEPVRLARFDIMGLDSVTRSAEVVRDLPLKIGDPFNRDLLRATADTIANRLRNRAYATAQVFLASRKVDSAARRAEVTVEVVPGRPMVIGSVRVEGAGADSGFVYDLMATQPGRPFRQSDIIRSQRNVASSEVYRFASVEVDTARLVEGSDSLPLVVRVVPGAKHRVSASTGYGTDDCFRMSAGYAIRNPFSTGRVVEFATSISKIGVGDPLDWGLQNGILCQRLQSDSIGSSKLNYSASVSLRRPAFLSPDNHLTTQLFGERRSEYAVYSREEFGGAATLVRETGSRIPITFGYRLSYGVTYASDVNFCIYFNACNPADISQLAQRQRQGVVSVGISSLRLNNLLDPTRGTSLGIQLAHSAGWTLSEPLQRFTRLVADASLFRPIGPGIVLALRARAGMVRAPETDLSSGTVRYVPPEQRFYAGGANDVRGYDRNELGPVVYVVLDTAAVPDAEGQYPPGAVQVSPIGGNYSVVLNAELRVPSPVFGNRMRFGVFVDGGTVWQEGGPVNLAAQFRVTPGVGARFATPLGPARIDVAYNGYSYPAGPLYESQADGTLVVLQESYVKPRSPGLTFHFAIGHAF